jgi:hypothetical protein
MRHVASKVAFHSEKRDLVQKALEQKYRGKLAGNIIYSGSIAKSTEINEKYDVDLIIPFKYDAFSNLEEMSLDLYKFFQTEFSDPHKLPPRNQRVSVGLSFSKPGLSIAMDIVPGREIKRDGYEPDRYLNLYDSNNNRYFQTNIKKQIDAIRVSHDNARNIIRLLKIWKLSTGMKVLKGFVLELLVQRAFKDAGEKLPNGLWPQLEMTLEYIRANIENARLVDPGNSNNSVSELIAPQQKVEIANAMRNMLNSIKVNPAKLVQYFPFNPKYKA